MYKYNIYYMFMNDKYCLCMKAQKAALIQKQNTNLHFHEKIAKMSVENVLSIVSLTYNKRNK